MKSILPLFSVMVFMLLFLGIDDTQAIPAFARKYHTSCSTCHYAYPELNSFGKAFRNNGFRYPGNQDPEMTKEEPISLGAESYKRVWPDAIWPSSIAGSAPISFQAIGRIHIDKEVQDERSLYFEGPHEIALLVGGTFGNRISYFGEIEYEHESEFGYAFNVNYDFVPAFHLKLGTVGLHASPEHHRINTEHYNVDILTTQSGAWAMGDGAGGGAEIWGAGNGPGGKGGFTYALGVGNGQNDEENFDLNKNKDFYGRATYKIGGLGEIGGTEGQSSETSAFYIDNSIRLGGFFYSGTAISAGEDDKFSVAGGDIDWWLGRLNVKAMAMQMKSNYMSTDRTSFAYFGEGGFVIFPWLIARARYEFTDADTGDDTIEPEKSIIPGLIAMVRANVKCSVEYMTPLDEARQGDGRFTLQFGIAF